MEQVRAASYGVFNFGPTVDGDFVPALPGMLLLHGQFEHNIRVMVGHHTDEVRNHSPKVERSQMAHVTTIFSPVVIVLKTIGSYVHSPVRNK